ADQVAPAIGRREPLDPALSSLDLASVALARGAKFGRPSRAAPKESVAVLVKGTEVSARLLDRGRINGWLVGWLVGRLVGPIVARPIGHVHGFHIRGDHCFDRRRLMRNRSG